MLFSKKSIFKGLGIILTGTAVSQILRISIAPLLTRLYEPSDFGVLAIFVSIVSILSIASSGRYDLAIPTAKHEKEAKFIAVLCLGINIIFMFFLFLCLLIFSDYLSNFLNLNELQNGVYLIPIALFFSAISEIYIKLRIKVKDYKKIAHVRVAQVVVMAGVQLIFSEHGVLALIYGQILGYLCGLLYLIWGYKLDFKSAKFQDIRNVAIFHNNYPKFSLWSGLISSASTNFVPVVLFASYSSGVVGLYALTMRILSIPASMLGEAFRSIFLAEAPEYHRDNNLAYFVRKLHLLLVRVSFIPLILLIFYSEEMFSFVFGERWEQAGTYAMFMAPWLYLQFKWAPLSMIGNIIDKQKDVLVLQILSTGIRYLVLFFAILSDASAVQAIMLFSAVSTLTYYFMIAWFFSYLKIKIGELIIIDLKYLLLGSVFLYPIRFIN